MLLVNYISSSGKVDILIKISAVLNYYINSFGSWDKWFSITVFIIINRYFIGLVPWLVIVSRIFFFFGIRPWGVNFIEFIFFVAFRWRSAVFCEIIEFAAIFAINVA